MVFFCQLTEVIEVEGIVPGQGAVEAGLEVARPARLVLVRPALVRLADPGHPGVDALRKEGRVQFHSLLG